MKNPIIHRPKTRQEFMELNRRMEKRGFIAIDKLKAGGVKSVDLSLGDGAKSKAQDMASCMGKGSWSSGPLVEVAWAFDNREEQSVKQVKGKDGKPLGLGYVEWGNGNCIPSVIPPLAQSLPYTAAPLRYIADLTAGMGPALMYRFPDGTLSDFRDAEYKIIEQIEANEKKEQEDNNSDIPGFHRETSQGGEENKPRQKQCYIGDYVQTNLGIMRWQDAESIIESQNKSATEDLLYIEGIKPMSRRHDTDYWNRLLTDWQRTWYGYDEKNNLDIDVHVPGAKEFLEENNLSFHQSQCFQDDVMLDIYFPTVGFDNKGTKGSWRPYINRVGFIPAHSMRLERQDSNGFIHHCYRSDSFRTLGISSARVASPDDQKITMYPAAMPQHLLHELRYIVSSNQKTAGSRRPMWVVCPTLYPSLNKPYYPQPAWWSVFTSKAFDFSSTILYDKAKQRENRTSWGRIIYISLDYLNQIFADEGYQGKPDEQQKFIDELEGNMEQFLQRRENQGKYMRQWMWTGADGKEHYSVEIADIKDAINDEVKAGKDELELSTSPIFLALQVDPRLVGVPMVAASNGGTALREMALLKQLQLNSKQRLYEYFLNSIARFNEWTDCAEFHIKQWTLTTLDNSKTGIVETIAGKGT